MKLSAINSGLFKLDGGAMFGVVPKSLWNKKNPADEKNMCTWCMRCLLIETGDRKILVDTGVGDKQDDKFRSHFYPHGSDTLIKSLHAAGCSKEDITDVFITHFHFDHVGGAIVLDENGAKIPQFPNATYWTNKKHYDWAINPNIRERASFLKENFVPLKEHGVLEYIPTGTLESFCDGIDVFFTYGHTEAMMCLDISIKNRHLIYCADLLPSMHHIGLPYVMSYDIRPLDTVKEKEALLTKAVERGDFLYFEHDHINECCTVKRNERGRYIADQIWTLESIYEEVG
jgi:glyoxylase-like metal-dependent hydrolase (beta-lactamase superfamily II)